MTKASIDCLLVIMIPQAALHLNPHSEKGISIQFGKPIPLNFIVASQIQVPTLKDEVQATYRLTQNRKLQERMAILPENKSVPRFQP